MTATLPRWLELQAAIDYGYWRLEQIAKELRQRTALDSMIDAATGYEDALEREARELMDLTTNLRAEFEALT